MRKAHSHVNEVLDLQEQRATIQNFIRQGMERETTLEPLIEEAEHQLGDAEATAELGGDKKAVVAATRKHEELQSELDRVRRKLEGLHRKEDENMEQLLALEQPLGAELRMKEQPVNEQAKAAYEIAAQAFSQATRNYQAVASTCGDEIARQFLGKAFVPNLENGGYSMIKPGDWAGDSEARKLVAKIGEERKVLKDLTKLADDVATAVGRASGTVQHTVSPLRTATV